MVNTSAGPYSNILTTHLWSIQTQAALQVAQMYTGKGPASELHSATSEMEMPWLELHEGEMFYCVDTELEHPLSTVPQLQINWLWGGISLTEPHHHIEPYLAKQETSGECSLCSILPVQKQVNIFTQVHDSQSLHFILYTFKVQF
jgi:hypothetical protein